MSRVPDRGRGGGEEGHHVVGDVRHLLVLTKLWAGAKLLVLDREVHGPLGLPLDTPRDLGLVVIDRLDLIILDGFISSLFVFLKLRGQQTLAPVLEEMELGRRFPLRAAGLLAGAGGRPRVGLEAALPAQLGLEASDSELARAP